MCQLVEVETVNSLSTLFLLKIFIVVSRPEPLVLSCQQTGSWTTFSFKNCSFCIRCKSLLSPTCIKIWSTDICMPLGTVVKILAVLKRWRLQEQEMYSHVVSIFMPRVYWQHLQNTANTTARLRRLFKRHLWSLRVKGRAHKHIIGCFPFSSPRS